MIPITEEVIPRKRHNQWLTEEELLGWGLWKPQKRLRLRWTAEDKRWEPTVPLSASKPSEVRKTDPTKCEERNKCHKFSVKIDVNDFKTKDIEIKVKGKQLFISGKHEERQERDNGFVCRQFTRRYELPEDCDSDLIMSFLSSDGKLTVEAPLKTSEDNTCGRVIAITTEDNKRPKLTTTVTKCVCDSSDGQN